MFPWAWLRGQLRYLVGSHQTRARRSSHETKDGMKCVATTYEVQTSISISTILTRPLLFFLPRMMRPSSRMYRRHSSGSFSLAIPHQLNPERRMVRAQGRERAAGSARVNPRQCCPSTAYTQRPSTSHLQDKQVPPR